MSSAARPVIDAVRGALIGSAEVVPGISGGTVALVVGVYERLLASIDAVVRAVLAVARRDLPGARAALARVHWRLVVPLVAGMVAALLIGARLIPPLIDAHYERALALFFGLILASLLVPYRMMHRRGPSQLALAAAAALAAFLLTGIPARDPDVVALPLVALAAAVAICALVLPGVSGSFLLLTVGLYEPTLDAVNERDLAYLAAFGLGAAVGLASFARGVTWLLAHRRDAVLAVLLGLMAGSLRAVWPYSSEGRELMAPPADASALAVLGFAALGAAIVLALLALARRAELSPTPAARSPS